MNYKELAIASLENATEARIKELKASHLCEFEFNRHRWGEVKLSDGTRIVWELTLSRSSFKDKASLAYHWHKNGLIERNGKDTLLYWSLSTYFYDKNNQCWGLANPQINYRTYKINFKWLLDATEANAVKLLARMIAMGEGLIK